MSSRHRAVTASGECRVSEQHARLSTKNRPSAAVPSLREPLALDRSSLAVLHIPIQLSIFPASGSLLGDRLLRLALLLIGGLRGLSTGSSGRALLLIRQCTGPGLRGIAAWRRRGALWLS
jgi:hypothetical protein